MNRAGLGSAALAVAASFSAGIAVDATSVYWTDNRSGRVMKLTPK